MPSSFVLCWSKTLSAPGRGLSLARECGRCLTWDRHGWLYLFDQAGRIQGQTKIAGEILLAALSEDGERVVVADRAGRMQRLAPDLSPRIEHPLPFAPTALAVDPFGRRVALADDRGWLALVDENGRLLWRQRTVKPLRHLAIVPGAAQLVGAGETGFAARYDPSGECSWKEAVVANIGGLSVDGMGHSVLLACFSGGIQRYDPEKGLAERIATKSPCRWVGQSLDGRVLWAGGLGRSVEVLDGTGGSRGSLALESDFRFLAVGAAGLYLWAALEDARLVQYRFEGG